MSAIENANAPSSLPQAPRRRWPTVLLMLVVFLSGGVIGAGGTLIVVRRVMLYAVQHPEQMVAKLTARLTRRLHLDQDQSARLESILRARQAKIQAIRAEFQPRIVQELASLNDEVLALLNDQQKAQWREAWEEQRRLWTPPMPKAGP